MQWMPTPTLHATEGWSLLGWKMFPRSQTETQSSPENMQECSKKKLKLALTEEGDRFLTTEGSGHL
jgi:hypothetical protein